MAIIWGSLGEVESSTRGDRQSVEGGEKHIIKVKADANYLG